MATLQFDIVGAEEVAGAIVNRRELRELSEKNRNKLKIWIKRLVLDMELSFE